MPARSQAQRELLNARFGHAWVKAHHFDNKGKLPAHVKGKHMAKQSAGAKKVAVFMGKKKPGPPRFPSPHGQATTKPGKLSGGDRITEDDPRWKPKSRVTEDSPGWNPRSMGNKRGSLPSSVRKGRTYPN